MKPIKDHQTRCNMCEKPLNIERAKEVEFSNTDGEYYKDGVPEGHESLGWYMVGPDRTSADWWQAAAKMCTDFLTAYDKIKFTGPFGSPPIGKNGRPVTAPGAGNTIFAFGNRALEAVRTAEDKNFGMLHRGVPTVILVGVSPSWMQVVEISINRLNGKATVQDIYEAVEKLAPEKIVGNLHWKEKIRQKLQEHFTRVEKGVYKCS